MSQYFYHISIEFSSMFIGERQKLIEKRRRKNRKAYFRIMTIECFLRACDSVREFKTKIPSGSIVPSILCPANVCQWIYVSAFLYSRCTLQFAARDIACFTSGHTSTADKSDRSRIVCAYAALHHLCNRATASSVLGKTSEKSNNYLSIHLRSH